ncbi:hypothetical protein [Streptomyces tubercidicus]|uniref:hypothetical protein n=1 Tax=Streptomyces tubercidicus TaxID=47759 RepID=UPI002E138AD5|nr:hypothetical protein OG761_21420 [Streptomyces tubercidicus]
MADLLSPIIAAISALSGAALTGFIGARSERRKEQALGRQQQRQQEAEDRSQVRELKAEHMLWRRERRQAAYEALVEATKSYERAMLEYSCAATSADSEANFDDVDRALQALERSACKVRLEGPEDVAQAAHSCESDAERCTNQWIHVRHIRRSGEADGEALRLAEQRAGASFERYLDDCWDFVVKARESLDEVMAPE